MRACRTQEAVNSERFEFISDVMKLTRHVAPARHNGTAVPLAMYMKLTTYFEFN